MHTRRSTVAERGLSLIEVLIAVVLMAIVAGGGVMAFGSWVNSYGKASSNARLASLSAEAWERAQADQSWRERADCRTGTGCLIPASELGEEDVEVRLLALPYPPPPEATIGYDVKVTVMLDGKEESVRGTIDDGEAGTGSVRFNLCTVSQVDERAELGSCSRRQYVYMRPPKQMAYEFPGYPGHPRGNPIGLQWEMAQAAGQNRTTIVASPVAFTVDVESTRLLPGTPPVSLSGRDPSWFLTNVLPSGQYRARIRHSLSSNWIPWSRKSLPSVEDPREWFAFSITTGTETLVAQYYEPRPVDVDFPLMHDDGSIPWRRRPNGPGYTRPSLRYSLIPLPEGRADIPGAMKGSIDYSQWPHGSNGDTVVHFHDIRPGLYQASYFHYSDREETLRRHAIGLRTVAYGANGVFDEGPNPPYTAEHARIPYLYIERDGTISPIEDSVITPPNCEGGHRMRLYERARAHRGQWYYDEAGGWMRWDGELHDNSISTDRLYINIAVGLATDVEPGTNAPLMANRRRAIFDLGECGSNPSRFRGGGTSGT